MPFSSQFERDIHFAKHGSEFGAVDALDYERMADAFMTGPIDSNTHECIRPQGRDRLRFGFVTLWLGVACVAPVFIKTFHVVRLLAVASHGGSAGYFSWQCGRIYP